MVPQTMTQQQRDINNWAMWLHFSQFLGFLMPVLGFAVPIAIWQIKKDVMPEIDQHGRNVANWLIAYMFYWVISVVLVLLLVGIALLWVLAVVGVIFPIIGGIKASQGEVWKYPGAFPFF